MRYTVDVGVHYDRVFTYENALKLRAALKKVDIDSDIVVGGLGIYPSNYQEIDLMKLVCTNFRWHVRKGYAST